MLPADRKDCCGCMACVAACPARALSARRDEEGFLRPALDPAVCTACGACERVCPVLPHESAPESCNQYFGAQAVSDRIRFGSSSGGVFPVLAESILDAGGIVYGAALDENMHVLHAAARDRTALRELCRTKYVQSDTSFVFAPILRHLEEGKCVLFAGTPCQTEALRLFLRKEYENLYLIDLICYGVPSPGVWGKYVSYLEKRNRFRLCGFQFRDKRNRDRGHTVSYTGIGQDGEMKECAVPMHADAFSMLFFSDLILRPSCHNCRFCTTERNSDVTIGDFWGIEKTNPAFEDGMGTSLVITHTEKGYGLLQDASHKLRMFACSREDALQPRLQTPTSPAKMRRMFMLFYSLLPFSALIKAVRGKNGIRRIWRW